jgi:O-antigen/teichoic acid export membrane protein
VRLPSGRFGGALARLAGPIAVAVAAQSAGNLAFHALVGRLLDPGSYGALGAVLAAMVMVGIPLGALQTAASAHVARAGASRDTVRRSLSAVAIWSLPAAVATLACAPLLRDYFDLASAVDAAILAPYLVVAALLATARGLLLGAQRVRVVAHTYLASTVARFAFGAALVMVCGATGALLATLLGEIVALLVAVAPLRRSPADGGGDRLRLGTVGRAAVAVTGLFLFSTVDLLLARHHLAGDASGAYVAAATVAKTVLALPAAIMSVMFPRLALRHGEPGRGRVLTLAVAAVAGPALLGAAVVVAVPGLVLRILYGDGYADAADLVRVLTAVAGLTSVVTVLTNAALARGARSMIIPWFGAVLEIVLIEIWHESALQVAACSVAALLPTLLLMTLVEGRFWWRSAPAAAPAGDDISASRADRPQERVHT